MTTRISNPRIESLGGALAGRYFIIRELGHGKAASVYLAHDDKHGRQVAVKVLDIGVAAEVGADRFLREIRLLAKLQHPRILPIYDSGESDGVLYCVMPHVVGESLRERLVRERRLPLEAALRIAREVAEALDYAHRQGVVHRDVKPENILIDGDHVLVADFGIARAITRAAGERTTAAGLALGTPAYMSPEQAMADPALDARADVYSLGIVVHEMLSGSTPFSPRSAQDVMARRNSAQPAGRIPDAPPELPKVIRKALSLRPAERYNGALEFTEALDAARRLGRKPKWRRWLPW